MEYRQIGNSDLQASVIMLGGYPFGPPLLDQAETSRVVAAALVGCDTPEHMYANVKALDWKLTPEERVEVDAISNWWDGAGAIIDNDSPPPRPSGA